MKSNHRRPPGVAALLVALAMGAAACGDDSVSTSAASSTSTSPVLSTTTSTPATTTSGPGGYGGEVVVGLLEEPVTLNFFDAAGFNGAAAEIGAAVWVGVADIDAATREFIPDVVVELPSLANGGLVINPDGTETVEYTIDPGAVWADGVPISGDDFRFTYETIIDPELPIDKTGYDRIVPGSIEPGPKSFRFTLATPSLVVESLFPVLLPAHVVEGTDVMADWTDRMWVAGGPFQFEQWSRGDFITLTRNPNYWKLDADTGGHLPYLDRVIFRFLPDVDTLVAEFAARRLDVITPGADTAVLDGLGSLEGAAIDVAGSGQWEHLTFQFGDGRLDRNPGSYNEHIEYRRAIAHAIDKERIVAEVLGGYGAPMGSYVDAFTPAWSGEAWEQYDYDPAAARQDLAQLCAKEGVDCAANPPTAVFTTAEQRVALASVLEDMLSEVGIEFRTELEPRVIFLGETIEFGTFDLSDWTWFGRPGLEDLVAAHRFWDPMEAPPVGLNYYRFGSPAVRGDGDLAPYESGPSSLIDAGTVRFGEIRTEMAATIDPAVLLPLVAEAEQILADELVFIPLYQHPDAGVVWADVVGGYQRNPAPSTDTWNVAQWHRLDS